MWLATSLIAVASTAASSVNPMTGSTSGMASSGSTKLGERADQRRLHRQRRVAIEGAVIGGEQIFGEGNGGGHAPQLAPEAALIALPSSSSGRQNAVRANGIGFRWLEKLASARCCRP